MVEEIVSDKEITRLYQLPLLNRSFDDRLNVVIVQKIIGEKIAQVIFFSTDLDLSYKKVIEYYSARFQIEFNFRDAKEFWGLDDFMNLKKERVENSANLSMFMVKVSTLLLDKFRISTNNSTAGIRDLISHYRAIRYFNETLKLLRKFNPKMMIKPEGLLF